MRWRGIGSFKIAVHYCSSFVSYITLTLPDVFSRGCLHQKVMPRHLGKSFLNIWWVLTAWWWCFLVRSLFTNLPCHCQAAQMAGRLMALLATNSRPLTSRAGTMHAPLAWECRRTWWASATTTSRHSSPPRPENTATSTFGLDSTTSESKGHSSGVTGHPQPTPTGIGANQTIGAATKIVLSSVDTGTSGMTWLADAHSPSFASEEEVKRNCINCHDHQFISWVVYKE